MVTHSLFGDPTELLPFDGSAILCRDFIGADRAAEIFGTLLRETNWEGHDVVLFGKRIAEPRLSTWHSEADITYRYSGSLRTPQPWTKLLESLRDKCSAKTGAQFNAVFVNLYRDGADGVGWHADNEPCNGPEPTIASLSFGATRRFDLRHRESKETISVQLDAGSLLIMSGLSQHAWVHQVPRSKRIKEPRINLTFRNVVNA